jgi:CTP:phosphocholine cytidylyltransferase-like protein
MTTIEKSTEKEKMVLLIKKGIELLCEKNISDVVILSSYKINSVLKDNYGVNIKVDKIGRALSNIAKRNELKRLSTNIPKYRLQISMLPSLIFE